MKFNVAIVGLGFGAEFIPIYQNHPNTNMYAICQRTKDARLCQCGTDAPDDHLFGSVSGDDEAADANLVTHPDRHPGRELDDFRGGRALGRQLSLDVSDKNRERGAGDEKSRDEPRTT